MISIITVNFNNVDFINLQIRSVKKYTTENYEHIVFDNSTNEIAELKNNPDITYYHSSENVGHGNGLNFAINQIARSNEILVLDSDAHILNSGWEEQCRLALEGKDLLAARGGELKPIRPCTMFFNREIIKKYNLDFAPQPCKDLYIDCGVYNYFKILHDGGKVGYIEMDKNIYKDVWGDCYYLNSKPYFYHNWYGSRFWNNDVVDGLKVDDFSKAKESLFSQASI